MTNEAARKETINTYNRAAKRYQEKFMDMDLYNDTFDTFCNLVVKSDAHILEAATGPGNITRYLLSKRPDFKIFGIDLAANMIELARKNNPSAEFRVMDCRDIGTIRRKFDAVMCGFCFPYLSKPEVKNFIKNISEKLNPSGIFYVSTMEGEYEKSGFETTSFGGNDRIFIYYHQAGFLKDCLHDSGFEVIDVQRKDYPESDGSFSTDLIILSAKK